MQWSKGIIHHENGEELIEYPIILDKPDLTVEGSVQRTFRLLSQKINNSYSFKILRIVPLPGYSGDISQLTYTNLAEVLGVATLYDAKGTLLAQNFYNGETSTHSNQDSLLLKTPQSNIAEPDPD